MCVCCSCCQRAAAVSNIFFFFFGYRLRVSYTDRDIISKYNTVFYHRNTGGADYIELCIVRAYITSHRGASSPVDEELVTPGVVRYLYTVVWDRCVRGTQEGLVRGVELAKSIYNNTAITMTAMLVFVAELSSNIFSVLAVLICFCGVFLFIMRYVV